MQLALLRHDELRAVPRLGLPHLVHAEVAEPDERHAIDAVDHVVLAQPGLPLSLIHI